MRIAKPMLRPPAHGAARQPPPRAPSPPEGWPRRPPRAQQGLDVGDELAENSGITWDEATFREYIKDPKAKVPGTKMIFPGLKDDKRIDDLIAYLKQFDASGKKSAARTPPRPMRAAAAMRDQREDETESRR